MKSSIHHDLDTPPSAEPLRRGVRAGLTFTLLAIVAVATANDAKDLLFGGPQCAWWSIVRPVCRGSSAR